MSENQAVFNFRIDRNLKERFEALAVDHGVSMSALVRSLIQLATSAYENPGLTTKWPGMTRIEIPLVLARPDLSAQDSLDAVIVGDSVTGKSETVCRNCIGEKDVIVSSGPIYPMLPARATYKTQRGYAKAVKRAYSCDRCGILLMAD